MRHLFSVLMVMIGLLSLSACNMVEGAGEDVKKGGEALEDAAEDAS